MPRSATSLIFRQKRCRNSTANTELLLPRPHQHLHAAEVNPAPRAENASAPKPNGDGGSDPAVVWKLEPDKSLRPLQIHIGLTDHTYTALTAGDLQPGDELVTGATTVKQEAAGPGLTPQRR